MLKFLLIILCVFLLLRMMTRNMVASSFVDMQQKMRDEMKKRSGAATQNSKPEGHVSVTGTPKAKSNTGDGDYVDYEEVK